MSAQEDLAALGRGIVDSSLYMVLGTADREGRPWVAPVYFAPVSYGELVWVSKPGARHCRHIAERAEVSIVIGDQYVLDEHDERVPVAL